MKKNIIIGILFVLFMASLAVIYYLVTNKDNEYLTVSGEVLITSKDYIIIESAKEDYVITNMKGVYNVGDEVEFKYKKQDLNSDVNPKTIKVSDEELIKVKEEDNKSLENDSNIIDNNFDNSSNNIPEKPSNTTNSPDNSTSQNPSNNTPNNEDINNTPNEIDSSNNSSADAEVISYFNDYQQDINSTSIKSLKNGFVTIVDFLFYNGTIKGHTFSELSNSAKLKVLAMALYFDGKIEDYFPGYKESISNTANKLYTNVKEQIVSAYLTLTTKVCEEKGELCESAKEKFGEIKKNVGLTWDLLKDIAGDGLTNLKNWYEIWRNS